MQLLQEIGIEFRKRQCPWITGGDWNMDPSLIHEWARRNWGKVIASGEATMAAEEFDFCVASEVLAALVKGVKAITT